MVLGHMTVAEALKLLKISRTGLYKWEKLGLIPSAPRDKNGWRIFDKELLEAMNKKIHPELYTNLGPEKEGV